MKRIIGIGYAALAVFCALLLVCLTAGAEAGRVTPEGTARFDNNGDRRIDVSDVTATLNYLAGLVEGDGSLFDDNNDGAVDISDVTCLLNFLSGSCPHEAVTDAASEPTCTKAGCTEGSRCVLCGEVLAAQEEIPALGHIYENGVCTRCGDTVISVGDTYIFGSYEQDANVANGAEPIEWTVLSVEDGRKVTLISKYVLDALQFNTTTRENTEWDECSMRYWLNGVFYNTAFTSDERAAIRLTRISDSVHAFSIMDYRTEDNVFLLSADEANALFANNYARIAQPTAYAMTKELYVSSFMVAEDDWINVCRWWLRVPGDESTDAALVELGGGVSAHGAPVSQIEGVRPVINIDLCTFYGHQTVIDPAVELTCTVDGVTEGSHCERCGVVFVAQVTTRATGHVEVIDSPEVHVGCFDDGRTKISHCSVCNETLSFGETIPAEHVFPLTETDNGEHYCPRCWFGFEPITDESGEVTGYGFTGYRMANIIDTINLTTLIGGKPVTAIIKGGIPTSTTQYIHIPPTVNRIDAGAFDRWSWMHTIYITDLEAWLNIDFGDAQSVPVNQGGGDLYLNGEKLTEVVIPEGVTEIKPYVFQSMGITKVTLPSTLRSIGECAFLNCKNLTEITFPEGLESIGARAFEGTAIGTLIIPDSVTELGEAAFRNVKWLSNVKIGSGITEIKDNTFYNSCNYAHNIVLPASVTKIGSGAFYNLDYKTSTVTYYWDLYYGGSEEQWAQIEIGENNAPTVDGDVTVQLSRFGTIHYNNNGHVPEVVPGRFACTRDGLTDGTRCLLCGITLEAQQVVPMTGHTFEPDPEVDGVRCTVCGHLYKKLWNGNYTFNGVGDCTESDLIIVASVNGMPVTEIANDAVTYNRVIESVYLPDTITVIGYDAFHGCTNLRHVRLNEGLTSIRDRAFNYTELEELTLPSTLKGIGYLAFGSCRKITSLVIPDSVTGIDSYAFSNIDELESVTFGSGITVIPSRAFRAAYKLTSVVIPEGITTIDTEAFAGCTSLEAVTIPSTVTKIGSGAFGDYWGNDSAPLKRIYISDLDAWLNIEFVDETAAPLNGSTVLYLNHKPVTSVVFPAGTTSVGKFVLRNCTTLTSVVIPEGVTSIGEGAFAGCTSLSSIVIPEGVTSIGKNAFAGCTSLESVTFPSTLTTIGENAFGVDLLNVCPVRSVNISDLDAWLNITFANIYANPMNSYDAVLCLNGQPVTAVVFPEGTTKIGDYVLMNCASVGSVTIPSGVTSVGKSAFESCGGIFTLTLPEGVISIGESAFAGCVNLTLLQLPDSLETIGAEAFFGCRSLVSVTLGSALTTIGDFAFDYCTELLEVVNNSGLTIEIGSEDNGCVAYYAFDVHTGESNVFVVDDYVFLTVEGQTYLLGYIGNDTELVLPELSDPEDPSLLTPYDIFAGAFSGCSAITSVVIPHSASCVGESAFWCCENLRTVDFGMGVTEIDECAFFMCGNLMSVKLGAHLTYIYKDAFSGCDKLVEVINDSDLDVVAGREDNGEVALHAIEVHMDDSRLGITEDGFCFYTAEDGTHFLVNYVGSETNPTYPETYNGDPYVVYDPKA